MIKYLGLGDYLTIAELILGIDGELLAKGVGIGLADSALAAPQASFDGIEFYPELERKAAVLLEHLVKNHPLPDGNKRTAYATMWMFITINGLTWTLEDPDEIVPMIIRVASGDISTEELTEWISSNIKQ
ncbi:type II toxin-antitoxin system death-on-curing family toxin [Ferrimicrobium sp.]|uniref:type II toxin-antitoxin system death-on-curing family toxin n=1 Tax=Ferrimicrobium sp. TaxID=2926050 RepID=UPI0026396A48|nr:type II toxin-antitoxin system death-on-curing family toxin [Ferrimicrobium sp.]